MESIADTGPKRGDPAEKKTGPQKIAVDVAITCGENRKEEGAMDPMRQLLHRGFGAVKDVYIRPLHRLR